MAEVPTFTTYVQEPCDVCPRRTNKGFCPLDILADDIPGNGYIESLRTDLIHAGFSVDPIMSGGYWRDTMPGTVQWSIDIDCPIESKEVLWANQHASITVVQTIKLNP